MFSTGGVLALGIGNRGWTGTQCEENLQNLLKASFAKSNRRLPGFSVRRKQLGSWKFHARPVEDLLKELFADTQLDLMHRDMDPTDYGVRVVLRSHSAGGDTVDFSNFPSKTTHSELALWESARATFGHKTLFKPFHHSKLGALSVDRTPATSDAVSIAADNITSAFGQDRDCGVEAVLSLGCITSPGPTEQSLANDASWTGILDHNHDHQHVDMTAMRLQLQAAQFPAYDDLSGINTIRAMVHEHIGPQHVRQVAARLFASLFYVTVDSNAKEMLHHLQNVDAQVLCCLPHNSPDIYHIGELFLHGDFHNLAFVFIEDGQPEQSFTVPTALIESELAARRPFSLPPIRLSLIDRYAVVTGLIKLRDGTTYSLSGFPRQLIKERKRGGVQRTTEKRGVSEASVHSVLWTPPPLPRKHDDRQSVCSGRTR